MFNRLIERVLIDFYICCWHCFLKVSRWCVCAGLLMKNLQTLFCRSMVLVFWLFFYLALPILRLCTGITFVILGLHNKLLEPSLAFDFLKKYHFNFFNNIGFESFSDLHFLLTAGIVEPVFGNVKTKGLRILAIGKKGFQRGGQWCAWPLTSRKSLNTSLNWEKHA